jgi:ABC-type nitrate/sulfonate/bicarbonate transport system permease component
MMAARSFRSTDLYAGIILLGLVGIANSGLLALIARIATPWRVAQT